MIGNFYQGKEWRTLLQIIRAERENEEGLNICEYCGKPIVKAYDCIGHHVIELTDMNVHDRNISLNPDNIQLVHHRCHNYIHNKLGYKDKKIYIVYGSPFAGKRTYVNEVKSAGDMVIDIDSIWQCVSGDEAAKDGRLKAVVFAVRDTMLECIKYRRGRWNNAYIIGGYPLISERERLANELGAELVYIDTSEDECIKRVFALPDNDKRDRNDLLKFIGDWWTKYSPPL